MPQDLIRAARVDGAGFFQIFWRIILPLSPPILIVTVIWQFTNIWNEFLFGITFSEGANRPVTAALMALNANIAQAREYGIESAAVLLAALPTLARLCLRREIFHARPDLRCGQVRERSCPRLRSKGYASGWVRSRCSRESTSRSTTGSSSCWSVPRAAASPRCSTSLPAWKSPFAGQVRISGRDVTGVAPKDRDIAMVFQSYALYPAMTVRGNITFGMECRGVAKAEQRSAVERVAKLLQIGQLLDRKPSQLSGGQRQRVAMGRALVRDPVLFLFDEPLSNLDAKLRVEMRMEIKRLHQRLGTTIVYVTHDQIEAMTLATRIAVMHGGEILQFDDPQTIYDQPANLFVAGFMGSPPMNIVPVRLEAGGWRTGRGGWRERRRQQACGAPDAAAAR